MSLPDHTPEQVYANITAAIDWCLANPDLHLTHDWAQKATGHFCDPKDPDATKFCVLGRLIIEAGLETGETPLTVCGDYLRQIKVSAGRLLGLNIKGRSAFCGDGYLHNRIVTRTHNSLQAEVNWGYHKFKEETKQ